MKKTYLRNKKTTSRRAVYAGGGILFLLVIGVFFSLISGGVRDVSSPFLNIGGALSRASASVFSSFFLGDAGVRIAALEDENENLHTTLEDMTREAIRYEEMVGRYGEAAQSEGAIIAGVLVTPPRALYDTIVIDTGSRDGIEKGAYVYAAHNRFLGTVVAVSPYTALVELPTSPGYMFEVLLGDEEPVRARAFGRGSGNMVIVIPRDVDVAEGEVVVLPGFDGAVVGYVDVIETEQNDPFQQVRVRMDVNLRTLIDVAVLPPSVTEFPEYVRSDDVVLDIDREVDENEEIDEGNETSDDDTSATSLDETIEVPDQD
jgi:cell shape-determining protein MreC